MEFLKKICKLILCVVGGTLVFKKTSEVYDNRKQYKQKVKDTKDLWKNENIEA